MEASELAIHRGNSWPSAFTYQGTSTMYETTEEDFSFNIEYPHEIRIDRNALISNNNIYQISNITRVTVRRWKHVKKDQTPSLLLFAWFFLGTVVFTSSDDSRARIFGALILLVGSFFFLDSRIKRVKHSCLLVIELNSATLASFYSTSEDFLEQVAARLRYVIENPHIAASFVANFVTHTVDNSIHDHSVFINGDLHEGLINTGWAQGIHNHL
jgi:hypothetical protein